VHWFRPKRSVRWSLWSPIGPPDPLSQHIPCTRHRISGWSSTVSGIMNCNKRPNFGSKVVCWSRELIKLFHLCILTGPKRTMTGLSRRSRFDVNIKYDPGKDLNFHSKPPRISLYLRVGMIYDLDRPVRDRHVGKARLATALSSVGWYCWFRPSDGKINHFWALVLSLRKAFENLDIWKDTSSQSTTLSTHSRDQKN
jgi:hypothetical protein